MLAGVCAASVSVALLGSHVPTRAATTSDAPPGAAIDDLYVFPVADPTLVTLAITVGPRLPRGASATPATFDPRVLYAIHIDNVGDFRDHLVFGFQADAVSSRATGQRIVAYGPVVPNAQDVAAGLRQTSLGSGFFNRTTILDKGVTFFAGLRRDPAFFDAAQFAKIRAGTATCFNPPGRAQNAFAHDDVLAIVITAPKTLVAPRNRGRINVWVTAAVDSIGGYATIDRAGRPFVHRLFAPQSAPGDAPADDATLAATVQSFAVAAPPAGAGRAPQTAAALTHVFAPDELAADIESPNGAAYLGIEAPATPLPTPTPTATPTPAGATPSPTPPPSRRPSPAPTPFRPFGGRAIADPAYAIALRATYGDLLSRARLVPDDGRETPCLANDGTTAPNDLSANDFPFLDAPL
jgi:hypothetical protein